MTTIEKKPQTNTPTPRRTRRTPNLDDPKVRREAIDLATRLALIYHRDALMDLASR